MPGPDDPRPSRWPEPVHRRPAASPAEASATRWAGIAYAYVPASAAPGTPVEVEIFGTWVGGQVAQEPLYDPAGKRVRA
jgi:glycine cleavage system aminomethyltransferase T